VRELLPHPPRRLNAGLILASLVAVLAASSVKVASLPLPVGPLSDYGSVLDRHGREEILALIEAAGMTSGIVVNILASWEDPYGDVDRYARAVLQAWGLGQGKTLLAVFLKTKEDWSVSVVPGQGTASAHPGLAESLEKGIANLVAHRRIEEAMRQLFTLLGRQLAPPPTRPARDRSGGAGRALPIGLGATGGLAVLLFTLRRICPRCGRLLRIRERRFFGRYGSRHRVYYCRRCGYSRSKGGEG